MQANLNYGIGIVKTVTDEKGAVTLSKSIFLEASGSQLVLTATDLAATAIVKLSAVVTEEGKVAMPVGPLADIVEGLPADAVEIAVAGNMVTIGCGRHKARINSDTQQLPEMQPLAGAGITVQGKELLRVVNLTAFAAATEMARPSLTAVLLKVAEQSEIVASDGFRIARYMSNALLGMSQPANILVPAARLREFSKLLSQRDESVTIRYSPTQVSFSLSDTEMRYQLIAGDYVRYSGIFPSAFATTVTFNVKELLRTVKLALTFSKGSNYAVVLKVDGAGAQGVITVSSPQGQYGDYASEVPADVVGQPMTVSYDGRYLVDVLSAIGDEGVYRCNGATATASFGDSKVPEYTYIIMPMSS